MPSVFGPIEFIWLINAQRAGQYIIEWGQILNENMSVWQRQHSAKREADNVHGNMPKRIKSEKASSTSIDPPNDATMKQAYINGALDQVGRPL